MTKKTLKRPRFRRESQEADWWASAPGRDYVARKSAEVRAKGLAVRGSSLVARLNKRSVQIALRLPEADLAQARKIADRKGIGYQTLLKMLVPKGWRAKLAASPLLPLRPSWPPHLAAWPQLSVCFIWAALHVFDRKAISTVAW